MDLLASSRLRFHGGTRALAMPIFHASFTLESA
jgi:hypothetical protein